MTDATTGAAATMTEFDPNTFNPHDASFLANPYPTYANFRAKAPVHPVALAPGATPAYWVFRHADVVEMLEKQAVYLKNMPGSKPAMPNGVFMADPPRHTDLRKMMDPLFDGVVKKVDPVVQQLADKILDSHSGARMEFYADYALALPPQVLFSVLGIPQAYWPAVTAWISMILAGHDITQPKGLQFMSKTAGMALLAYFQAYLRADFTKIPAAGLFPLLAKFAMAQKQAADKMTPTEVQTSAVNVSVAGYLSTTFLIATSVHNLLQPENEAQLAALRKNIDDDAWLAHAVEEMLRFDAPAQLVDRVAIEDVELGGMKIPKGSTVTGVLGSANHDETVFDSPDTFDLTRADVGKHVAFGVGIHYCLGAPLARRVAPLALRSFFHRYPNFALGGTPAWQTDPYLRSVSNLPLTLG